MKRIHSAVDEDLAFLASMEAQIFSDPWSEEALRATNNQPHGHILVSEDEGGLLGYAVVYYVADEGEIARIAVQPSRRQEGIGRSLLDAICEEGKKRGATRVLLDVRESNGTARTFYETYGFRQDGIRPNFYQSPKEHAILMSFPIEE